MDRTETSDASAYAHAARAQDLLRRGELAGALDAARAALDPLPRDYVARTALGSVFYDLGELDVAADLFAGVLADNPRYADALNNMGNVLARRGNPRAGVEFFERALAEAPDNAVFLSNLGGARQAVGDVSGALACFERALACDPASADAQWNRAIARLLSGDLAGGFADYEARWRMPEFSPRAPEIPVWSREPVGGKTLLLQSEQGYGDTIQMVRFAPALAAQGARVVLETHAPLVRLLRTAPGLDHVIARGDPLPRADFRLPIMSLPRACGLVAFDRVPYDGPYLRAPDTAPSGIFGDATGVTKHIGLAWAGRATHKNDRNRSMAAGHLAPLADLPGCRFFALQPDARADDLAAIPGLVDLGPHLADFAATAAILDGLDLVISVDTALAHLAGAMGKPCWLLLPFAPDWRWLLDRADSPWYPSLRLFRQPRPGAWDAVVAGVRAALA